MNDNREEIVRFCEWFRRWYKATPCDGMAGLDRRAKRIFYTSGYGATLSHSDMKILNHVKTEYPQVWVAWRMSQ